MTQGADAAGFRNLAAEAQLGSLKLSHLRGEGSTALLEEGAAAAFSYNWYTGMSYLSGRGMRFCC